MIWEIEFTDEFGVWWDLCIILLLGGDKTGNDRWYDENVPIADRLYDKHLELLKKEGLIDD